MKHRFVALSMALLGWSLFTAAWPTMSGPGRAWAQPAPGLTLNFVQADIEAVTRAMSVILGQPFVVDPRVKGSMTLYSDRPISASMAYANYVSALRGLGYAVVQTGGLHKVVPEAEAKLLSTTVVDTPGSRQGDGVLTQIFKLQHENVNHLVPILRPLISPNNIITANPGNNSLVVTDYAANLQRISKIIAALDLPAAGDLEIIPLQHALASDLAPLLQKLQDPGAASGTSNAAGTPSGPGTTVMAEPRSNALIVRAPSAAKLALIRQMVSKLDRPGGAGPHGGIWVVYLKNADASRLATILRAAFPLNGTVNGAVSGAGSTGLQASPAAPGLAGAGSSQSAGGVSPSQASATALAPLSPSAAPSVGGMIQADASTNSLIITAPEPLYRQLRSVIDQLDARRAQVYIESMIVKVDAGKMAEIGVQWQGISGSPDKGSVWGGGTNFGSGGGNILDLSLAANQGAQGAAGIAPSVPNGFNIGLLRKIGSIYTLGALARFLETNASANVLSTPNLVALDNEESRIVIGQNVPFVTGSFTNTGTGNGATNPFQTVERRDVGLTLKVKPQIGENGSIRLALYQENSSVIPGGSTAVGPITDKSAIETTVVVDDGDIMVLGGLLKEETTGEVSKVPWLGDVPVLGTLFRQDNRKRSKSNLLLFLRPVVMRTREDSVNLSMDRYDWIRAKQAQNPNDSSMMPLNQAPTAAQPTPAPAQP